MEPLSAFFGPKGALARTHRRYEHRPGQVALAEAVERALEEGRHLDAEAPAGIGKSFAYLVPLIRRAVDQETPSVVVTANIALQEQLVRKDLPLLKRAIPLLKRTLPRLKWQTLLKRTKTETKSRLISFSIISLQDKYHGSLFSSA